MVEQRAVRAVLVILQQDDEHVVTVHGTVEGSIQGKKVHLVSTATVRGDIFHDVIGIDPGAQFEGASKRIPASAAVANDSTSEAA